MKQKRYTEEQIALALRQAEGGTTVASLAQFGRPTLVPGSVRQRAVEHGFHVRQSG